MAEKISRRFYVALLRGINVGTAKKVPIAELKTLFAGELGFEDVKTLLNSGNVVFSSTTPVSAETLERAFTARFGFGSRMTVLSGDEMAEMMTGFEPPAEWLAQPSRLLIAVWTLAADRELVAELAGETWGDEALVLGPRWAYFWCPNGVLESKPVIAVAKALKDRVTTRTWGTMTKIAALTGGTR